MNLIELLKALKLDKHRVIVIDEENDYKVVKATLVEAGETIYDFPSIVLEIEKM